MRQRQNANSRAGFVARIREFVEELSTKDELSELSALDLLERIAAYAEDIDGYYKNFAIPEDADVATWENFENIIRGACVYE